MYRCFLRDTKWTRKTWHNMNKKATQGKTISKRILLPNRFSLLFLVCLFVCFLSVFLSFFVYLFVLHFVCLSLSQKHQYNISSVSYFKSVTLMYKNKESTSFRTVFEGRVSPCSVVANTLDSDIVVSEFKLRANSLGKGINLLIPTPVID